MTDKGLRDGGTYGESAPSDQRNRAHPWHGSRKGVLGAEGLVIAGGIHHLVAQQRSGVFTGGHAPCTLRRTRTGTGLAMEIAELKPQP